MRAILALSTVVLLSAVAPARAAPDPSFDCARASTPVERAICSDEWLASLDRRLAGAYSTVRGGLDDRDRAWMLEAQREWLRLRPILCQIEAETEIGSGSRANDCLTELFQERIEHIEAGLVSGEPDAEAIAAACEASVAGQMQGSTMEMMAGMEDRAACLEEAVLAHYGVIVPLGQHFMLSRGMPRTRTAMRDTLDQLRDAHTTLTYHLLNQAAPCPPGMCGSMFRMAPAGHYATLLEELLGAVVDQRVNYAY